MKETLKMFMDSEGVGEERQNAIIKYIDQNDSGLDVKDWLMHTDGMLGLTWQKLCMQVEYDLERLNIDDTVMVSIKSNGRKHFNLPAGFSGEKLARWIEHNKEIIDYWVSLVELNKAKTAMVYCLSDVCPIRLICERSAKYRSLNFNDIIKADTYVWSDGGCDKYIKLES